MAERGARPDETPPGGATAGRGIAAYLLGLWRGQLPLSRAFWTEMLLVGTLANVLATIAALALFASGAPVWIGVLIHFAPLPFNMLLLFAVWQAASREAMHWSFAAQVAAVLWFVATFVI